MRSDVDLITSLVPDGAVTLDIGCGDGALLAHLQSAKRVRGVGLEIDSAAVAAAVSRGLAVVQGDADTDLDQYPDDLFDIVILSNSLQALRRPDQALRDALRIGRRAIISFPNFGHWRVRTDLLFRGRMPVSKALPAEWYETTNIHLCTVNDFITLRDRLGFAIDGSYGLGTGRPPRRFDPDRSVLANWAAESALFSVVRG